MPLSIINMKYPLLLFGLGVSLGLTKPVSNEFNPQPITDFYIEDGISPNFKMIAIPAGTFMMGCTSEQQNCYDDEKPAHRVSLNKYYISETEVTQAQWEAVMGSNPSYFRTCPDCPVEQVSWESVQIFINKLNETCETCGYRLPTEAEWEYAARGGESYQYAGSNNLDDVAWYDDNASGKPHPVKTKAANAYGLYDMTGNVWEWCSDWYGYYSDSTNNNPQGPNSGAVRVFRGSGWNSNPKICRVAYRYTGKSVYRYASLGFRLVSSQ